MRQPEYRGGLSLTTKLIILLVVVYALQCIDMVYLQTPVQGWLALTTYGFKHGWVWQLFTFQFLHGSSLHLIGNLISFWWLGQFAEHVLGKKRFLIALFGCGAVGGILQGVLMSLFPIFGQSVVGASAGVSGLLAIYALLQRDAEINLYMVLPIRAIYLLWIWAGYSLFFILVPAEPGMAHAAHLGGMLAGIAWVKLGWHHDYVPLPWEGWIERLKMRRSRPEITTRQPAQKFKPAPKPATLPVVDEAAEVDAVLDKISARGLNSLTARERAILDAAHKKMAGR